MVKNVNAFKLTDMVNQRCIVKKRDFSSTKIPCMKDYIKPTLRELDPEHVILHVGTNNRNSPLPPKEIADGIIDLAKSMKTDNRNITISTIIPRGGKLNNKANEFNNFLMQLCGDCNIPFINQSNNINPHKHLNRSKLHFNITGNRIFVANIKLFVIKCDRDVGQGSNISDLLNSCSVLTEFSENESFNSDPNYIIRKNDSSAESLIQFFLSFGTHQFLY